MSPLLTHQLGLSLPFLDCPPRQDYKPYVPKAPCAYRKPGRLECASPMRGEASATRHELGAPAELLTDYQLKVDLGEFLG